MRRTKEVSRGAVSALHTQVEVTFLVARHVALRAVLLAVVTPDRRKLNAHIR